MRKQRVRKTKTMAKKKKRPNPRGATRGPAQNVIYLDHRRVSATEHNRNPASDVATAAPLWTIRGTDVVVAMDLDGEVHVRWTARPDAEAVGRTVYAALDESPALRGMTATLLDQLSPRAVPANLAAVDVECGPEEWAVAGLDEVMPFLFPPTGTRMVSVDVPEFRRRNNERWAA